MPCPVCRAGTFVSSGGGRYVASADAWVRVRTCYGNPAHTFETVEHFHAHEVLAQVPVAASRRTARFDRDTLLGDLSWVLGPILGKPQRNHVIGLVEAQLENVVPRGRKRRSDYALGANEVTRAVAAVLYGEGHARMNTLEVGVTFRRAHVAWELARGQFATDGDGFDQLEPLRTWLGEHYPRLLGQARAETPDRPHYGEVRRELWHPLRNDAAPHPRHVVYRRTLRRSVAERTQIVEQTVILNSDGTHVRTEPKGLPITTSDWVREDVDRVEYATRPFEVARLRKSVARCFHGRSDAEHRATYVVQWVLWALAGQEAVRDDDLTALTTQCLRRVDAVAYLRWALNVKAMTVADVWREVHGLVNWPAPRLEFPAGAAADHRVSAQVQPDIADQLKADEETEADVPRDDGLQPNQP